MAITILKASLVINDKIDDITSKVQIESVSSIEVVKQDNVVHVKQNPLKVIVVKYPAYKNHVVIEKTDYNDISI